MSIVVSDISYSYNSGTPNDIPALYGVSMSVERGEWVSIVGHTGSGKSTLAQHLNLLLVPRSGIVSIDGVRADYSSRKLRDLRRSVGLVFQYPESQFFAETVRDEIQFAPSNWGVSGDDLRSCVDEAMAGAGINPSLLDSNPFALSGGQRRRVAIASVLAMKPAYLVLDEPTAGLDMSGVKDLTRMLNDLRGRGLAVVQVTHDLGGALSNSDRILVLENGRAVIEGKPEKVARYLAEHPARGLLLPETAQFARGLRNMGVDVLLTSGAKEIAEALEKERSRRRCV